MRQRFTAALLLAFLFALPACHTHQACTNSKECKSMSDSTGVYRHVVAFKFKEGTTDAQIKSIVAGFADLPNKIDAIIGYEHGLNVSPEGHDQGFTHVFIVTFKDKTGLDIYLPHPAHKAFVEKLLPILEQPFVVDYVAK